MNKALEAARQARKENGIEYLNPREKFEKKPTRTTGINAKCYDCMGSGADTGWKWMIGNCECKDCSLYPFRPYQNMHGKKLPKALEK